MTAEDLKKAILQQAIQGKLVPQNPNDEPASILLERIREEKARLVKEKKIKKDKNESIIYKGEDNSHYEKFADGTVKCIDDEIPFEIPESWCWSRFSNVIKLLSGRDLIPNQYNSNTIGVPYMTGASNFSNGELIINRWTTSPITISQKGDLLITCKGTIGEMAYNNIGEIHIARQIMAISTNYMELSYIKIFLSTLIAELNAKAKSMIPGISRENILDTIIPIPPLNEQKRIAQKIEKIQPLIDKYRIAQEQAEEIDNALQPQLKKSILQYAIQGKLVPQREGEESASILLEKTQQEKQKLVKEGKLKKKDFVESHIFKGEDNKYYEQIGNKVNCIEEEIPFEIPESWRWCRLSNIANLYTGNSINETDKKVRYTDVVGTNYIATKDVGFDHLIDYNNGIAIPDKYVENFRIAPSKSVLMCIEGGSAGRKIGILSQDVCFGNKLCCFISYVDMSEYIYYYLQSPLFFEIFSSNKNGIIGGVSVNNLKQLFIPLPPLQEQRRIVERITKINKGIESI